MKSLIRKACCIGFVLLGLSVAGTAVAAGPTISLQPATTDVGVGVEFDLSLMIDAAVDTFSNFQIVIEFDPSIIQFVDAFEGSLYTSAGHQTFFDAMEESLGTWEVFEVIFPSTSFILAPGEMVILRFLTLAEGTTPIDFLSGSVMDIARNPLDSLSMVGAIVNVTDPVGIGFPDENSDRWELGRPYPNPSPGISVVRLARPRTPGGERHRLAVYDIRGRVVRVLESGGTDSGSEILWDGRDTGGANVSSGIYFFKLETRNRSISRKLILVR